MFCTRCLLWSLMVLLPASSWPEEPFSFDSVPGRLPKDVVPSDYTVEIVPNIEAMTLAGTETIVLQFRSATATVRFNSLNASLRDVRLDGRPVQQVDTDDSEQETTLTLTAPATLGRHTLTFAYTGKLETLSRDCSCSLMSAGTERAG